MTPEVSRETLYYGGVWGSIQLRWLREITTGNFRGYVVAARNLQAHLLYPNRFGLVWRICKFLLCVFAVVPQKLTAHGAYRGRSQGIRMKGLVAQSI